MFAESVLQSNEIYNSSSAEETILCGEKFSARLHSGDVVALYGNLGSGKTKFTQGICKGLRVLQNVYSPTFTLINEYDGDVPVFHFDCYRLKSSEEIFQLGFKEYLERDGICIIEWAERAEQFLPVARFAIFFETGNTENLRRISIEHIGQK